MSQNSTSNPVTTAISTEPISIPMTSNDPSTPFVVLMSLLPKNLISFITGWLARLKLPEPLQRTLNGAFVGAFKINMNEAELGLSDYKSIEDVFTRKLKAGLRTIQGKLVSPADGFLARSGPIKAGQLIQAKGLTYDARELVFGGYNVAAPLRDSSWFTTVYLAPHNYHRVHSSVSGRLTCIRHLPANLWPVNLPFVENLPRLFCRNERLVFDIETEDGGVVHAVMVGAFNVGRMETPHLKEFATNEWESNSNPQPKEFRLNPAIELKAGDELGTFLLGSTVVLVFDQKAAVQFQPVQAEGNKPILMGQALS